MRLLLVPRYLAPLFCPPLYCPPLPPRPFTPAGVKGSLNSQFVFLGRMPVLVREVEGRVGWPRLVNVAVVVNGWWRRAARLGALALAHEQERRQPQ